MLTVLFPLQVLSKGRMIHAGRVSVGEHEVTNFPLLLTSEMVPAFRFVAYYVLPWLSRVEVVADSVSVDVESHCVGSVSHFAFDVCCVFEQWMISL